MRREPDQLGDLTQAEQALLQDVLAGQGLWPCRKLRPLQGGRTSRVWSVARDSRPSLILKLTRVEDGTRLFSNLPELEWEAMVKLSPRGLAPFPIAIASSDGGATAILSQAAEGIPSPKATETAALLARIHAVPPWPGLPVQAVTAEAILHAGDRMLSHAGGAAWLSRMRPEIPARPVPPVATLVHRDLVPANMAAISGTLVALDWQCPALGDPVEDLVHASSPAMQSLAEHHTTTQSDALVAAYPDCRIRARFAQLEAIYRWRMTCYCFLQHSTGAAGYARALELECAALEQAHSEPTQ